MCYIDFGGGKMGVSERIKNVRQKKGLSQKELGALLGVSQQMIGQWESPRANLTLETMQKLATALEVSLSDIMGIEEFNKLVETKSRIKRQIDNGIITTLPSSLLDNYSKLNDTGKREADKRVQELTEISRYTQKENNAPDKDE